MSAAVTFAVVLPSLLVAHSFADHWVQTDRQAADKGLEGWPGRWACAAHVATYTLITTAVVGTLWLSFDLAITPLGFVAGQLISAVSHYWADRRVTLRRLCDTLGKGAFYRLGAPRSLAAWGDIEQVGQRVSLYEAGKDNPVSWDTPSLGTDAYALDQSWHWAWLGVAAFATAVIP